MERMIKSRFDIGDKAYYLHKEVNVIDVEFNYNDSSYSFRYLVEHQDRCREWVTEYYLEDKP